MYEAQEVPSDDTFDNCFANYFLANGCKGTVSLIFSAALIHPESIVSDIRNC